MRRSGFSACVCKINRFYKIQRKIQRRRFSRSLVLFLLPNCRLGNFPKKSVRENLGSSVLFLVGLFFPKDDGNGLAGFQSLAGVDEQPAVGLGQAVNGVGTLQSGRQNFPRFVPANAHKVRAVV